MRRSQKLIIILFTLTFVPFPVFAHSDNPFTIHMDETGFSPRELTIKRNDVVIFENTGVEAHWPASNIHPTHEEYVEFDPARPIPAGQSWSFIFSEEGTWKFHDHLFPEFLGTVTILPDNHADEAALSEPDAPEKPSFIRRLFRGIRTFFVNLFSSLTSAEKEKMQKNAVTASPRQKIAAPHLNNESGGTTPFREPPSHNATLAYQSFDFACGKDNFGCISESLKAVTDAYGPEAAIQTLERLQNERIILPSVDDHQLVHRIGRQTAASFGVNTKSFLLCPMNAYNGGCQHGFFEHVLGKTSSSKEAADLICKSLGDEYSEKARFYCYHGVGHGVMMAYAYDLPGALSTCAGFDSWMAEDGCAQGVFMENTNAGMSGEARSGIFSADEPLLPCTTVEEKYRHECFLNHAGWLMQVFHNSVQNATAVCLNAPNKDNVSACLQSIGLMVTNPTWQRTLFQNYGAVPLEKGAWELCLDFPAGHRSECVIGAVDNIMNFDELDVTRANAFCLLVQADLQTLCARMIGLNAKRQSIHPNDAANVCEKLNKNLREGCLSGGA